MIYLDASLLVSLYCPDTNSAAAGGALQSADTPMLLTPLGEVEAFNAMQLRVFRKEISSQQAEDSAHHFEYDLQAGVYRRSSLPDSAFERARQLSRQLTARLGTRTADLLHVAAALELGATSFFSFDLQQRKMAEAVGLKLNPWP